MSDPDDARTFTAAQHAGSLAGGPGARRPAAAARRAARLLDVGGGSGAFSIASVQRNPDLRATLLDFPHVLDVARIYRDAAGLDGRIALLAATPSRHRGPAGRTSCCCRTWSARWAATRGRRRPGQAHASLRPGGLLVVHDFLLDDVGPGPAFAALWFLQYLAWQPDALSFTAAELRAGSPPPASRPAGEVLIPQITKVVLARKVATS